MEVKSSTGTEATVGVAQVEHETASTESTVVGSKENAGSVLQTAEQSQSQTAEPSTSQGVTLDSAVIAKPTSPALSR